MLYFTYHHPYCCQKLSPLSNITNISVKHQSHCQISLTLLSNIISTDIHRSYWCQTSFPLQNVSHIVIKHHFHCQTCHIAVKQHLHCQTSLILLSNIISIAKHQSYCCQTSSPLTYIAHIGVKPHFHCKT